MRTAMRALTAAALLALPVLLASAQTEVAAKDSDAIMKAMEDEMARNMARLSTPDLPAPYYMAVTVQDRESFGVTASFGGVTRRSEGRRRSADVDIRVGGHSLDQTNFVGGGFSWGRGTAASTPLDDEPDALRQALWLLADSAFKTAHESLARKKAWLEMNTVKDRPDDFTKVEAHRHLEDLKKLEVDRAAWEKKVKELSSVFREFPEIQSSSVRFSTSLSNRRFATSDGFRTRRGVTTTTISVSASTQAEDGMSLNGRTSFEGRTPSDLPPMAEMKEKIREMAGALTAKVTAPHAEEYLGPVLLEGPAAAELFRSLLISQLSRPREPLGTRGRGGTVFKNRLHRRVLPDFLTVYDDPTVEEYAGTPLLGAFPVDDDGVPSRKVTLVDKGRLRAWYMSRVPTRKIRETNGHSRRGSGGPGCVFVKSDKSVADEKLLDELRRMAKDQELTYGLRIVALESGGRGRLGAPALAYRVPVDGGVQIPIRCGAFQEITLRTLRDVILTGTEELVTNNPGGGSVVCPAVLLEEMVILKPPEEQAKRPVLRNPYFAQKR